MEGEYQQVTSYNLRRTTCDVQITTHNLQPTTYNLRLTTYNLRRSTLKVAGEYLLSVTRGGDHISGSRFALTVLPDRTHAASCRAHGAALRLGSYLILYKLCTT